MRIDSQSHILHPLRDVYEAYRDHLPELARYIPDIREILVKSRVETPAGPKILNEWVAEREIPKVAQGIIKPEMTRWEDHAQWNDAGMYVDWRLVIPTFQQQVRCAGRNQFRAQGDHTVVHLTGELEIDLRDVPGVPRLLAGRIAPMVEEFIVKLVTPNLARTNESLGAYLDDRKRRS
jgi:hypothetical protein